MSLLPEEITSKTFPRRIWRGYDQREVDTFLQRVAADYAAAIQRISDVAEDRSRSTQARDELVRELTTMAQQGREAVQKVRQDAETDATAIRQQAEQAASDMLRRAEETASALTRQAEQLRAAAQQDTDAALRRLDQAEQQARKREEDARRRCDALQAQIEHRRERLQKVEHQLVERLREASGSALRSHIDLADQAHQLTRLIAEVQDHTHTTWAELDV